MNYSQIRANCVNTPYYNVLSSNEQKTHIKDKVGEIRKEVLSKGSTTVKVETNLTNKKIVKTTSSESLSCASEETEEKASDSKIVSPHKTRRAGRVRISKLPQEVILEKFIEKIKNKHPSWTIKNPASEWDGVTCNNRGEVVKISWDGRGLKGTLNWRYLPPSLNTVDLQPKFSGGGHIFNFLEGEVDFSSLPPNLTQLRISDNNFTGTLALGDLPKNLEILELDSNKFSDYVVLEDLPEKLWRIDLRYNPELKG